MNEATIQTTLYRYLFAKGHVSICPGYTPSRWFECDVFSLTKAGLMFEHEIKITVADFKADSKKTLSGRAVYNHDRHEWDYPDKKGKHELLAAGDTRGPSAFYYVVPEGLIKAEDVPLFAGLIYWCDNKKRYDTYCQVIKRAPKLHKKPVDPDIIHHVNGVFFYRYWNIRHDLASVRRDRDLILKQKGLPPAENMDNERRDDEKSPAGLYDPAIGSGTPAAPSERDPFLRTGEQTALPLV